MKKTSFVDVAVIGGGFAGLATAYQLTRISKLKIVVLEREPALGGHASGNNAGMIRQAIADPYLGALAREGCRALTLAARTRWAKNLRFRSNGSLLITKKEDSGQLRKISSTLRKYGVPSRWFSKKACEKKVSLLEGAAFDRGLYCPSDAFIDIGALLQGFLTHLGARRVPVLKGVLIKKTERSKNRFTIETAREIIVASKVVNAAGAWCSEVAQLFHASAVPLKPYRRHLFESKPFSRYSDRWPFVWDLSGELYFRPLGERVLLMSPCDQTAVSRSYTVARHEKVDSRAKQILLKKLEGFSGQFRGIRIDRAKSGLRTMTPDGRFVVGEDPKLKGFYWVAGLGGHGVTTSFSIGKLAAEIVLGKNRPSALSKALSPKRFFKKGIAHAS